MTAVVGSSIRVQPCPQCPLCNGGGTTLYRNLNDRLFGVQGTWDLSKCLNGTCEAIWLNPMPIEEDIPQAYRNYYTHQVQNNLIVAGLARRIYQRAKRGYLASRYSYHIEETSRLDRFLGKLIFLHPGRRADIDFEVFYLKSNAGGRLLEVGSGSGIMLNSMQEHGWQAEGVDFDFSAVENARSKGLVVHHGSLEDQEFPLNTFDAVVMSHVIEHVPNPSGLLQECNRILKPGGYLVLITPNTESLGHRLFESNWRGLEPPRHLLLFNQRNINKLVVECGYYEVKTKTTIRDANGMMMMSRALSEGRICQMGMVQARKFQLWGRIMQLREWFFLKINKNIGEELVVIARK